jgi:predicted Zn-dependent peptidase
MGAGGGAAQKPIPPRPEELAFDELRFDVPEASRYRHELKVGVPVYVVEDHTLPLVDLHVLIRQGSHLDPADEVGLAAITGALLRTGGTDRLAPEAFDEEVEFLAADLDSSGGDTRATAGLGCITSVLAKSMDLFFEMLRRPRFDAGRLEIEKANLLEAMRQRNDDADDVLAREWDWLLYGREHYSSRRMTKDDLDRISREDLARFHRSYWRPENMIVSVAGDVDTASLLAALERHLSEWPGTGADTGWPPPLPAHQPTPGVYHVEKDIPQGKVVIGHRVPQWSDWRNPDRAPLQVMDSILGGGGFTSRIVQRIRSDEGLAYSVGSDFAFDPFEPGAFTISFQSKNETVALAAKIALEEMRRMQREPVSASELEIARSSLRETFPQRFESARQIASTYAYDAYIGRSHDYWKTWRDEVSRVTAEDVQRVARQYLRPDEVLFLVVGKWEEIAPGDPDHRASMKDFYGGAVTHIPLRDPLTFR